MSNMKKRIIVFSKTLIYSASLIFGGGESTTGSGRLPSPRLNQ